MRQKAVSVFDIAAAGVIGTLFAGLLLLLGFTMRLEQGVAQLEAQSPILLSRHTSLPSSTGEERLVPIAWNESSITDFTSGLNDLGLVTSIALRDVFFEVRNGTYMHLMLLEVDGSLLEFLYPGETCSSSTVLVSGADELPAFARLTGQSVALKATPANPAISVFVPDNHAPVGVRCTGDHIQSPRMVFLPHEGEGARALEALQARSLEHGQTSGGFADPDVSVELLSKSVSQEIERSYGWLPVFRTGFILLVLLAVIGLAISNATMMRTGYQVRRALGAPFLSLWRLSAGRIGWHLGLTLLFGLALATIASLGGPSISFDKAAIRDAVILSVLLFLAALLGHGAIAIKGVDSRIVVITSAAGSRWNTIAMGFSLVGLTTTVAVFGVLTMALMHHANAVESLPLGYEVRGLYAAQAFPRSDRIQQDLLAPERLGVEVATSSSKATIICTPPWDMDRLALREDSPSTSVLMSAGPHVASVLGLNLDGRDFALDDQRRARISILQAVDATFEREAGVFGLPIARVAGLRIGALAPRMKNTLITTLGTTGCASPTVVIRNAALGEEGLAQATQFVDELQTRVADYQIGKPEPVNDIIERARKPLKVMRTVATVGFAVAFACAILVTGLLAGVYVRSRGRAIAIRHALGERTVEAAAGLSRSSLKFSLVGAVLALIVWFPVEARIAAKFHGFTGPVPWELGLICIGTVLLTAALIFIFAHKHISRTDLVRLMSTE